MRSSASTPAFALLDEARNAAKQRAHASLNRSQSLTASTLNATPTQQYTAIVHSTPFVALPGVSSSVKHFSRAYSQAASLNNYASAAGRLSSASSNRQPSASDLSSLSTSLSYSNYSPQHSAHVSYDFSQLGDADVEVIPDYHLNPPLTYPLLLAVTCAVLSSFQNGFNSALLNVPEPVIRTALHLSDTHWSLVVSIFCIGGLLGCSVGGLMSDRLGRKNFLVTNNCLFILGTLLQSLATGFYMLLLGRFVIGVACGGCTVVVPLYLGEISPANLRGSLGTMNQFATVIGILLAVVMGRPMGTPDEWRYLIGLVLVPSMLQIVMSASLLESPLWLIVTGGNKGLVQAEEILLLLRGQENVDFDLDAMIVHRDATATTPAAAGSSSSRLFGSLRPLFRRSYRRPLVIGFLLQVSQQLSGINAVFYYSTSFFAAANVGDPWLGSVLCCTVNVAATWLALSLMDRMGRKTLLLISAVGMAASAVALTYFLTEQVRTSSAPAPNIHTHSSHPAADTSSSSSYAILNSYLSIAFVLLYVTFFELGLGPIPWTSQSRPSLITIQPYSHRTSRDPRQLTLPTLCDVVFVSFCFCAVSVGVEIYPAAIRSSAMSVSSTINWLANFAVSLAFPHMSARLGPYAFVPFVAFLVLTSVFVGCGVPETRGKSLEEIAEELGVDEEDGDEYEGVDGVNVEMDMGADELDSVAEADDGSMDDELGNGGYQTARNHTGYAQLKGNRGTSQ